MGKLEKMAVKKEPKMKHSYIIEVIWNDGVCVFDEAFSLKEVSEVLEARSKVKGFTRANVFKTEHNFVQAYKAKI